MRFTVVALLLLGVFATVGCTPAATDPAAAPSATPKPGLTFLGAATIPRTSDFQGTTVGGLSGISRDPRTGSYYLISDDRSERDPARFYTATVTVNADGDVDARLTGTKPLRRPDGSTFPSLRSGAVPPDPEGVAVDPGSGNLYWVDEGERSDVVENPSLRVATPSGAYVRELPIPASLRIEPGTGPRRNQALEGVSFTPDGRQLFTAMEEPLRQDGPNPTPTAGALTRITQYVGGRPVAQYAYPLEPLFTEPREAGATGGADTNGLSDLIALGNGRFLVIERAAVPDRFRISVRVFLAESGRATDVLGRSSLRGAAPMTKTLLLDLDDAPVLRVDNFEGATLGPALPDGRRTVLLVSDDNFHWALTTQIAAFALAGL
ncbi:esterase-like activity of phytase family protein [Cryptosporangium aurantiacum]|uniref:3-phytase n=1 Tax=Cryptosporangium aurantiacum TaxID=134849 RepID=A0A1M7KDB4_9ACTN|nr:esterase-like activity of phytase family protein [Cryptosporangium aurantiacum]SHM63295.1 3-phytase [Cryptosporangium aurantiacum]